MKLEFDLTWDINLLSPLARKDDGPQRGSCTREGKMQTGDLGSALCPMGFHEDNAILAENIAKTENASVNLEKHFGETVAQHVRMRIPSIGNPKNGCRYRDMDVQGHQQGARQELTDNTGPVDQNSANTTPPAAPKKSSSVMDTRSFNCLSLCLGDNLHGEG